MVKVISIMVVVLFSLWNGSSVQAKTLERATFIEFIAKQVEQANRVILLERAHLTRNYKQWSEQHRLTSRQLEWLKHLAHKYKLRRFDPTNEEHWETLFARVDIIPPSLAIAQSIQETGWGRSRFAQEGNNYFGQWCFQTGCGLVPERRPAGATHEVAKFSSVLESVQSYLHNLNTHAAYAELREMRRQLRTTEKMLAGYLLAAGLLAYSEQGDAYISKIRAIIKHNNLEKFDPEFA